MGKRTGLLLDDIFLRHRPRDGHPEQVARYTAVADRLRADGWVEKTQALPVAEAAAADLARAHAPAYIELARAEISQGVTMLTTGDTEVSRDSFMVACHAAGGTMGAVDAVCGDGPLRRAFCAVRPPGHHATPDRGMGFCIFNNAAVAAQHARAVHGVGRVAIVDWDVHHGNGTQDIFYGDAGVFYFSTHQHPWYPGTGMAEETGSGEAVGTTLNVPLPAGTGMAAIEKAFRDRFLPAMETFKPELVIISAGFDSRLGDPLGKFRLGDDDFVVLTEILLGVADRYAGGRLVSVLEGGYNLGGLASAASAHVGALVGDGG